MATDAPHILLVNPWIHDFAAYDFWAKPLGLLTLAAVLRRQGFLVTYIDCLDRFHPEASAQNPTDRCGRGPYHKTRLPTPAVFSDVPRRYSRYGILPDWLEQDLAAAPRPDLILVGSMMTYWYPGVQETMSVLRRRYPDVPILLGGVYATLCPEHACRAVGADRIVPGPGEGTIAQVAGEMTGWPVQPDPVLEDLDVLPPPALDLQRTIGYVPLLTTRGCPYRCPYCASFLLEKRRLRRSVESVVEEIRRWHQDFQVIDFVFYDDALLLDAEIHAIPLLTALAEAGLPVRFHTPNALHVRAVTEPVARLMHRAGFATLRLGLETAGRKQRRMDQKTSEAEFKKAVAALRRAGFSAESIGIYLLAGLPGQSLEAVLAAVEAVRQAGVRPIPAYYSPIPGTDLWPEARRCSRYDLDSDPLYTNNAVLPCWPVFSWPAVSKIKAAAGGPVN